MACGIGQEEAMPLSDQNPVIVCRGAIITYKASEFRERIEI